MFLQRFDLDGITLVFPASISRALGEFFWMMRRNMVRSNSRPKPTNKDGNQSRLDAILERDMLRYAAAASAAGVGMLAGPQPAAAEIVYTLTWSSRRIIRLLLREKQGIGTGLIESISCGAEAHRLGCDRVRQENNPSGFSALSEDVQRIKDEQRTTTQVCCSYTKVCSA